MSSQDLGQNLAVIIVGVEVHFSVAGNTRASFSPSGKCRHKVGGRQLDTDGESVLQVGYCFKDSLGFRIQFEIDIDRLPPKPEEKRCRAACEINPDRKSVV